MGISIHLKRTTKSANTGILRATFCFHQIRLKNYVIAPQKKGDFFIDKYTFKIGGKKKKQTQIAEIEQTFVVKDDVEFGYQNVIPLWAFGMSY